MESTNSEPIRVDTTPDMPGVNMTASGGWEANHKGNIGYFLTKAAAVAWLSDHLGVLPKLAMDTAQEVSK